MQCINKFLSQKENVYELAPQFDYMMLIYSILKCTLSGKRNQKFIKEIVKTKSCKHPS